MRETHELAARSQHPPAAHDSACNMAAVPTLIKILGLEPSVSRTKSGPSILLMFDGGRMAVYLAGILDLFIRKVVGMESLVNLRRQSCGETRA